MAVNKLTQDDFANFLSNSGSKIVKFSTAWCAPCKALNPVFEELDKDHATLLVGEVDLGEAHNLSVKYSISSVPTIIVFDNNGQELDRMVGYKGKEHVKELFSRHA